MCFFVAFLGIGFILFFNYKKLQELLEDEYIPYEDFESLDKVGFMC